MIPIMLGSLLGVIPALLANVGIDIITTKEQKQASRVANMEAIKALDDYRNFADYDNSNAGVVQNPTPEPTYNLADFQKMAAKATA